MIYSTWIDKFQGCVFIICSFVIYVKSDVPRPRGVSLSKASMYSPSSQEFFTCLDGTMRMPFSYVNDDYCDCFDGTDEPGTSACTNGVFHCTNAGHRPRNIPSSRVNDGICDCCDGTDEYASQTACINSCEELGREARAEAQRLADLHKAGSHLRLELVAKGNKKRSEMAEQLSRLEKDKAEAETIKTEKEALKNEVEAKENEVLKVYREAEEQERQRKAEEENEKLRQETSTYFDKIDSNSDGKLSLDEIKVVNVFDKDKNGEVDLEEQRYFMGENDTIDYEAFISVTWPLLKPLLMMEQGMFKPAVEDEEQIESNTHTDTEDDTHSDKDLEAEDLEPDDENVDADLPNEDVEDHEVETEQHNVYDEETQKIVDQATEARRQYSDAERAIREIESNIKNIKENLEKDYGLQQEFATMDGDCYEYEDKEYIYKLCLFQKVTQKSKNGGSEVGLGNWGEWAGEGNNKYSVMKYTNGVGCWNGPNRMTTVNIHCGVETKLLSVTEPFRCEYKIELSTPAACDGSNAQQLHELHDHDEL